MATIKQAINNFYNKPKDKEREIGKYHASELWAIYKGYTTPSNFLKQKPADKEGQANMFRGSAMEDMLGRVLVEEGVPFKTQQRLVYELTDGIEISGRTDFEFEKYILETKCPKNETDGIPDKWKFQLEFYARVSKKDVFLGIFPKNGDEIIKFYKYEMSDKIWNIIEETVIEFNKKILKKYKKNGN